MVNCVKKSGSFVMWLSTRMLASIRGGSLCVEKLRRERFDMWSRTRVAGEDKITALMSFPIEQKVWYV